MYHHRRLPHDTAEEVLDKLDRLVEFCKREDVRAAGVRFTNISSILNGKGIPTEEELKIVFAVLIKLAKFAQPYNAFNALASMRNPYRCLPLRGWSDFTNMLIKTSQYIFKEYKLIPQEISPKVVGILTQIIFLNYKGTITQEEFEKIISDAFEWRDKLFITLTVTNPEDLLLKRGKNEAVINLVAEHFNINPLAVKLILALNSANIRTLVRSIQGLPRSEPLHLSLDEKSGNARPLDERIRDSRQPTEKELLDHIDVRSALIEVFKKLEQQEASGSLEPNLKRFKDLIISFLNQQISDQEIIELANLLKSYFPEITNQLA